MKKYIIEAANNMWDVIETETSQIIKSEKDRSEAIKLRNRLLGGQGFNGCTPAFFLIDIKKSLKNLNRELELILSE